MKRFCCGLNPIPLALVFLFVCAGSVFSREAGDHIKIIVPYAKIYKALNPDSGIVRMAHLDESFLLDQEMKKWYRIWVDENQAGYIFKSDAKLERGSQSALSRAFRTVMIIIVLFLCAFAIFKIASSALKKEETP